jgi:hypothetical protein
MGKQILQVKSSDQGAVGFLRGGGKGERSPAPSRPDHLEESFRPEGPLMAKRRDFLRKVEKWKKGGAGWLCLYPCRRLCQYAR